MKHTFISLALGLFLVACGSDNTGGGNEPVGGGGSGETALHSYRVIQRYDSFFKRDVTFHVFDVNSGEVTYLQRYGKNTRMEAGKVYAQYRCTTEQGCEVYSLNSKGEFVKNLGGVSISISESDGRRTIEISDPYRWTYAEGSEFSLQAEAGDEKSPELTATLTKE